MTIFELIRPFLKRASFLEAAGAVIRNSNRNQVKLAQIRETNGMSLQKFSRFLSTLRLLPSLTLKTLAKGEPWMGSRVEIVAIAHQSIKINRKHFLKV